MFFGLFTPSSGDFVKAGDGEFITDTFDKSVGSSFLITDGGDN